jgi:hypothetical protein
MNFRQVNRIDLSPDVVDAIVFWSKNPKPMLDKLPLLADYPFYFQFTLNSYSQDIETGLRQFFPLPPPEAGGGL